MRVLSSKGVSVYIYDDEHPPPHCHIIFSNKTEVVVGLPFLEVWYCKSIDKKTRMFLENNLEMLLETWDNKHNNKNIK